MHHKVFIRVDGSVQIGLGHIVRCLALSQMLKENFIVQFFSLEIPESIVKDIVEQGFMLNKIKLEEDFFSQLSGSEIVVLDHYGLDSNYQKRIKEIGCKLVCIDDLHNKEFFADLIINHAPGVIPKDYQVQSYTQFALGLDYALLRPAFLKSAKLKRSILKIETLFICFGGSDFKNLTEKCLTIALNSNKFKKIIVVVGVAYQEVDKLKKISIENDSVEIFEAIKEREMLGLIRASDLAIVPSSGILLEVMSTGCTVISGMYADNQKFVYAYYKNSDLIIDAEKFNTHSIKKAIGVSFKSYKPEINLIDGNSGKRINELFLNLFLILRKLKKSDCQLLYKWANDSEVRHNAFNPELIDWKNHVRWFENRIINPNTQIFILENNGSELGQIRFEREEDYWKIDYSIDRKYRGLGFGKKIVELGIKKIEGNIKAWVKKENRASLKVFENLGFNIEFKDDKTIQYILSK